MKNANVKDMIMSDPVSVSVLRSRIMGILVLAIILGPMLAAYIIYKSGFGIPTGTINKGDLLPQAQSIAELSVATLEGEPLDLISGKKQWRLLIPAPIYCTKTCLNNLYTTRQIHIRLGEKARRVERVLLLQNPQQIKPMQQLLGQDHPRLKWALVDKAELKSLLQSEAELNRDIFQRYYLMDQQGFIMMSYSDEHTGNDLLKDTKRMLKYSYEER
jgi:cytochrome oxidase Cu insertion factor (SCO1/SenC/PrrC family)